MTICSSLHAQDTEKPSVTDHQLGQALNDPRFLKFQIDCALNRGPCDDIGIRLKSKLFTFIFSLRKVNVNFY